MKYLYALTDQVSQLLRSEFRFTNTSETITETINKHIKSTMLTASGKRRYPHYYETSLRASVYTIKGMLEQEHTLHGYWFKDEFYTYTKNQTNTKDARDLERLIPFGEDWTKMAQVVHKSNLKKYY